MSIAEYKESIKKIVDATDDEALLKGWKILLERDLEQETKLNLQMKNGCKNPEGT